MKLPRIIRRAQSPAENRNLENPEIPISDNQILELLGNGFGPVIADVRVTVDTALAVPAFGAAVRFLSGTMAALPLHTYRKKTKKVGDQTKKGREKVSSPQSRVFSFAANDETTSINLRRALLTNTFTHGRGVAYLERQNGRVINWFLMDPLRTTVKRLGGRIVYEHDQGNGRKVTYPASDVIDVPFMLKSDGITTISPVALYKEMIGEQIAARKYGAKFFAGGGVPPFVVHGNFQSSKALKNAATDLWQAIKKSGRDARQVLTLPLGLEAKPLGVSPEKAQSLEVKKFGVTEIARIFSLPPAFLQDLTTGTFNNTEQQDLQLVKHTLRFWLEYLEQELNLKVYGRGSGKEYLEHMIDALLRGDFKSRMDGYQKGVIQAH